jgi:TRAP-type uncharacterized transport system substrate-binding protein
MLIIRILFSITIPQNLYNTQLLVGETIAIKTSVVIKKDISQDAAYKIVKALFESRDLISEQNIKGFQINTARAVKGFAVPLHMGAQRYYYEIGVLKEQKKNSK